MVVPSLESALYSNFRLFEWESKQSRKLSHVINSGLMIRYTHKGSLADGLINMAGIVMKHYLKEELLVILKKVNFRIINFQKVEYRWDTEFNDPPKWMGRPYPWDWLILSSRI